MKKTIAQLFALSLLVFSGMAAAAPKQVDAVYNVTRNGQPFATVTESYRQENGRYRIDSVTEGLGAYALFGKRKLSSEGEVTAAGLKPQHFELHQGDSAKKTLLTDFDWASNKLTMKIKGKPSVETLEKGAQDLASFPYQFMFSPPTGAEVVMPVTTGKQLNVYHYKAADKSLPLDTPAGKFKTVHLVNTSKDNDDQKEFWLGAEAHYLPVRITLVDDIGSKIEQTLTSLHVQ
jgi:hypothetical protein